MREAKYSVPLSENRVECRLCPHRCIIAPGGRGICEQRVNAEGALYTRNYGQVSSIALDPIEKKPLYHFYPGSIILSIGTIGCNFHCSFCQNWQIAQQSRETVEVKGEELIEKAVMEESVGIAFTYNEPSIWYEFVLDTCRKNGEKGLKNVLVTNGFMEEEPLKELLPFVHGMNIDVKAYTEKYYQDICGGSLESVKKTVERAVEKCHVEITTLIINELNDDPEEMRQLASWLSSLDRQIPLHLIRYFPSYKMDRRATQPETLLLLKDIAKEYLDFVFIGNMAGIDHDTFCPRCGSRLIERSGYRGIIMGIQQGQCAVCKKDIHVVY